MQANGATNSRMSRTTALKAFGKTIKELRLAKGLSQERLALLAKLDRTYVGSAERGERNVALLNILRLAKALGVRPSRLLEPLDSE